MSVFLTIENNLMSTTVFEWHGVGRRRKEPAKRKFEAFEFPTVSRYALTVLLPKAYAASQH